MKYHSYIASFIAGIGLIVAAAIPAQAADIVIGVPNWPSAQVVSHILKIVLEDRIGLEVKLEEGTNQTIFEGMDSGSIHIHPEGWLPNQNNFYNKFVKERQTVRITPDPIIIALQGICVTKGTAERTGITRLAELSDPDMAKKFDSDGDGKGEIWIGFSEWNSTRIEEIRAKSYGYDKTMYLEEMAEFPAIEKIRTALAQKRNVVFFCYLPNQAFVEWEVVMLKEQPHDPSKWNIILPPDDPDWLEKSFATTAWDKTYIHIFYASQLESLRPAAVEMLKNFRLDAETYTYMSHLATTQGQHPEEVARNWMAKHPDWIDSWLP